MKKWLIILLILAVVGIISAFLVWKFYINKPKEDISKATVEITITSNDLFNAFITKKALADSLYNDKVVQIEGIFDKVENTDSLTIIVFAIKQGDFGDEGIRCTLLPEFAAEAKNLVPKSNVKIKGLCNGYNETDVIIEKCSIIK